ncbi:MAG: phosphoribosylamine--glycine ligase [Cytophagales bacterium]|nr:phosphoribosylamine--glycine ligase [Cytophagales bacterium]
MNILVIGSGGREHTLSWKISQSPLCEQLYVAPGNAGTSAVAQNVNIGVTDFEALGTFALDKNIEMIVVGPEAPLVSGIRDFFLSDEKYSSIKIVGPDKAGAELEGSKDFAKEFMEQYQIPTAQYRTFTRETVEEGLGYLDALTAPVVLKADGLAAGKGVIIAESIEEAKSSFKEMLLEAKFGEASAKVVIEEFLEGIELSVFVLTDGKDYVILPEAKDYKRIGEGDTGLNTGGMGAVSPVPFAQGDFLKKVEEKIVKPTIAGLQDREMDYVGFVFIGLMNIGGEPYVIEYNVRMGDPETEAVIPRIQDDLTEVLWKAANKELAGTELTFTDETAATVVMVAGGYPGDYAKGDAISGIEKVSESMVFHAGTAHSESGEVVTNGGRVIAVTALGKDIPETLHKVYQSAEDIQWDKKYFRRDIGQDVLAYKI